MIGAGGLGQFAIQYLRLLTEARAIAIDVDERKRARALQFGAAEAVAPEGLDQRARVIFDLVGSDDTLALAARTVETTGAIVLVGEAGGRLAYEFRALPFEATLTTSVWGSHDDLHAVLELAEAASFAGTSRRSLWSRPTRRWIACGTEQSRAASCSCRSLRREVLRLKSRRLPPGGVRRGLQRLAPSLSSCWASGPKRFDEWRRVVRTLQEVHALTKDWRQRPGFKSSRQLMVAARGGDVDLAAMPAEAVQVVRECWEPVLVGRECAIHGDSGAGDVLVDGATVALLDWDESRVEVPWFDFAHLPLEVELVLPDAREKLTIAGLGGKRRRAGSRSPNTRAECCASCTAWG